MRKAFTLIELLVVIVIIGMLMGLLLPAVQNARESARRSSCQNNLKQMALAVTGFEVHRQHFPSSWRAAAPDSDGKVSGWSALAQILPYLEQSKLYSEIDFAQGWQLPQQIVTADGSTANIAAQRIPTLLCPTEAHDRAVVESGVAVHYPTNYAVNLGTWLVHDPSGGSCGSGVFFPNSRLRAASISDGLTFTTCLAEVKPWVTGIRNAGLSSNPGVPTAEQLCTLGGTATAKSSHTRWVDGRCDQTGFTTVFGPNAKLRCDIAGESAEVDWSNLQEGTSTTISTWAAITARSSHQGSVNVALMDGSVRSFADDVNLGVWRAYSTRAGGEIIPSSSQDP